MFTNLLQAARFCVTTQQLNSYRPNGNFRPNRTETPVSKNQKTANELLI